VPEIGLQRAGIVTVVRQLVAASMSQHVRVNLEAEPGFNTGALDDLGKARFRKRRFAHRALQRLVEAEDCAVRAHLFNQTRSASRSAVGDLSRSRLMPVMASTPTAERS
jgi:hypothetical protein